MTTFTGASLQLVALSFTSMGLSSASPPVFAIGPRF
jgi:hypothetical protein